MLLPSYENITYESYFSFSFFNTVLQINNNDDDDDEEDADHHYRNVEFLLDRMGPMSASEYKHLLGKFFLKITELRKSAHEADEMRCHLELQASDHEKQLEDARLVWWCFSYIQYLLQTEMVQLWINKQLRCVTYYFHSCTMCFRGNKLSRKGQKKNKQKKRETPLILKVNLSAKMQPNTFIQGSSKKKKKSLAPFCTKNLVHILRVVFYLIYFLSFGGHYIN